MRNMICHFDAQARISLLTAIMLFLIAATASPLTARAGHPPQQGSSFRVVALEGDAAPAEIGGTYSRIVASSINNSDEVVFSAQLAGASVGSAIIRISGDVSSVLLRSGEQAPAGGRYKTFLDLDFARFAFMGKEVIYVLFRAEMEGGTAKEGIFLWTPDEVKAIALEGGKSARRRTYVSFTQLTINAITTNTGPGYSLAFVANTKKSKKTLVFEHSISGQNGELNTGDLLETFEPGVKDVIDDFVISRMSIDVVCVLQVHRENDPGKSYRRAVLFHGSVREFWRNLQEGARYTTIGKLKRVLEPPAIFLQMPLIAADFKKQRRGLLSTGFFAAGIAVLTGDPAPGVADETIVNIGPPISNANYPSGCCPLTIVSTIALSSGRTALLILLPSTTESRLMLIGGSTGNERIPVLRDFSGVKLSDHGTLLLRGTVGEGSATREGLFLLDRLFER